MLTPNTWGQPRPAVRRSEATLFCLLQENRRAALDRTAEGGCPQV